MGSKRAAPPLRQTIQCRRAARRPSPDGPLPRAWEALSGRPPSGHGAGQRLRPPTVDRKRLSGTDAWARRSTAGEDEPGSGVAATVSSSRDGRGPSRATTCLVGKGCRDNRWSRRNEPCRDGTGPVIPIRDYVVLRNGRRPRSWTSWLGVPASCLQGACFSVRSVAPLRTRMSCFRGPACAGTSCSPYAHPQGCVVIVCG